MTKAGLGSRTGERTGRTAKRPRAAEQLRYIHRTGRTAVCKGLLEFAQCFPALTQQPPEIPALIDCLSGEETMLQRVLVPLRCARSLGSAMHSATRLSRYCRRSAHRASAGLCSTSGTGHHRRNVAGVTSGLVGHSPSPPRALKGCADSAIWLIRGFGLSLLSPDA